MAFLKSKEERSEIKAARQAAVDARRRRDSAPLERWEYKVKRIGEDKQKGLLGSQRMEQILNAEGARGWELAGINMERAILKRRVVDISQAELALAAEDSDSDDE